jgi:hypothetical protein
MNFLPIYLDQEVLILALAATLLHNYGCFHRKILLKLLFRLYLNRTLSHVEQVPPLHVEVPQPRPL